MDGREAVEVGVVAEEFVDGRSDRKMGDAPCTSHRTVARRITGILSRLGASSRTAAALAVRHRLV